MFWRVDTESGLRGFLPAAAKGARDYRVACVGDSIFRPSG